MLEVLAGHLVALECLGEGPPLCWAIVVRARRLGGSRRGSQELAVCGGSAGIRFQQQIQKLMQLGQWPKVVHQRSRSHVALGMGHRGSPVSVQKIV